jgi:hypothetical protein
MLVALMSLAQRSATYSSDRLLVKPDGLTVLRRRLSNLW